MPDLEQEEILELQESTESHNPFDDPQYVRALVEELIDAPEEEIRARLSDLRIADLAHIIENAEEERRLPLIHSMSVESRGYVLNELDDSVSKKLILTMTSEELAQILKDMESSEATYFLRDMSLNRISEILSHIPLIERINITELLSYPENTAGALMSKEFVAVTETETVKKAIKTIRKISKETDDIHTVFVLDLEGKYRGHISLSKLILTPPTTRVKKIMENELIPLPVGMDREEAAHHFTRYDFITVPVVDERGVMLGRITVDDILEVVQEEASEDFLRMGGVSGEANINTPIFRSAMHRIIWLVVNLGTAFISSYIVSLFEQSISKIVILAALMPVIGNLGGNAAGQSLAVVVRNIALGLIGTRDTGRTLLREVSVGLINGTGMSLISGSIVYLVSGNLPLSLVVTTAMFANILIASFAGTLIPMTMERLKIDPAIASSIFVTTLTDITGFSIFLGLATFAMKMLWL